MKNQYVLRLSVLFCLLFLLLIEIHADKNSIRVSASGTGNYAPKSSPLDVVVIGSSAAYRYIIPAQLWKSADITSCVFGKPSQPFDEVPALITQTENSLHPSLYVIEIRRLVMVDIDEKQKKTTQVLESAGNETRANGRMLFIGQFFDKILSFVNQGKKDNVLQMSNADNEYLYEGAQTAGSFNKQLEWDPSSYRQKTEALQADSEQRLRDVLNLCENEKLNVLFVSTPYVETKLSVEEENYAAEIIENYHFPYINFNYEYGKIGIDFSTDFYDNRHVNTFGAVKMTRYLAEYLKTNYLFTAAKTSGTKEIWADIYKTWATLKCKQENALKAQIKQNSPEAYKGT